MIKTLKVSEDTHYKLKLFCAKNKLKINEWIEKLIVEAINKKYENPNKMEKKLS